jgi:hypothetical protein
MPSFGSLVPCTTGGMMVLPPRHCPNGQRLGPNRVLVGHQPCAGSCHDMPRLRLGHASTSLRVYLQLLRKTVLCTTIYA